MSYNIPTGSGQIRLGYDFNRCFYHNTNNSAQLNFDNELIRETSVVYGQANDTPWTSGAQKNLSAYRGATGARGWLDNATNAETNQTYQSTFAGGTGSASARVAYNWSGSTDYNRVGYMYAANGGTTGNTAANLVVNLGYLEPGTYKVAYYIRIYNSGTTYAIVRGYSSGFLSGSYTNYVLNSKGWSSGSYTYMAASGSTFTVNSTYPYVIIDFEGHNNNQYFLRSMVLRKGNTYGTTYNFNPFVLRT